MGISRRATSISAIGADGAPRRCSPLSSRVHAQPNKRKRRGVLTDIAAAGRLSTMQANTDQRSPAASAIRHFHALDASAQADAIHRLAATGMGDHEIARLTGLHVAFVRKLIGESRGVAS